MVIELDEFCLCVIEHQEGPADERVQQVKVTVKWIKGLHAVG